MCLFPVTWHPRLAPAIGDSICFFFPRTLSLSLSNNFLLSTVLAWLKSPKFSPASLLQIFLEMPNSEMIPNQPHCGVELTPVICLPVGIAMDPVTTLCRYPDCSWCADAPRVFYLWCNEALAYPPFHGSSPALSSQGLSQTNCVSNFLNRTNQGAHVVVSQGRRN